MNFERVPKTKRHSAPRFRKCLNSKRERDAGCLHCGAEIYHRRLSLTGCIIYKLHFTL